MELINFVDNMAFNYFASLMFWLLVICVPFFAIVSVFRFVKKDLS
jgi:hypothetical protein